MKITTVINSQNLNTHSNHRKNAPKSVQANALTIDNNRRFDTFTMTGTEKSEKSENKLSAAKEELIRGLSTVSEEDKATIAFSSYLSMMKSCYEVEGYYQNRANYFSSLKEQQAYYTELEAKGGVIEGEGKYAFSKLKEGDLADMDDIAKKLSGIQDNLDRLCGKSAAAAGEKTFDPLTADPMGENSVLNRLMVTNLNERLFAAEAAVFSAVTGLSGSALEIEPGDFNLDMTDINEENFLQKTNEMLNSISDRKKALTDTWTQYFYDNAFAKEKAMNPTKTIDEAANLWQTSVGKQISQYYNAVFQNFGSLK